MSPAGVQRVQSWTVAIIALLDNPAWLYPPASLRISQESLRRWEKSAREATVICSQTGSFNHCLFKVQQDMQSQLKSVCSDTKGKSSTKVSTAMDELQYLMDFNASISQAAAKTMEHLSEFVFISMANLTLTRRDSYLTHVKTGIKADTVAALRQAPIHISTLFPDDLIKRAEEEISHHESKGTSHGKGRFHPYERPERRFDKKSEKKTDRPAWKNIGKGRYRKPRGKASNFSSQPAKGQQSYKWQSMFRQVTGTTAGREHTTKTDNEQFFLKPSVNCHVVQFVPSAPGHSQKKEISPGQAECHYRSHKLIWTRMPSHQQPFWAKWWRSCRTPHARESLWLPWGGPTCLGFGIWWPCPVKSH